MNRPRVKQLLMAAALAGAAAPALGANPDFPGGERAAVEVTRDYEFNREDPMNATAVSLLLPASSRATLWLGLRQDTAEHRNEVGAYATRRRVSLHLAVRVYLGGGR